MPGNTPNHTAHPTPTPHQDPDWPLLREPYHLLGNVDIGLSKGFWQELLPERVDGGGVNGHEGHHDFSGTKVLVCEDLEFSVGFN